MPNSGPTPDRFQHFGERLSAVEPAGRIRSRRHFASSFTRAATRRATSSIAEIPISPPQARGASVDGGDVAVAVGRLSVADAGAPRAHRRARDAARPERRQARDAGIVDAETGVVVERREHVVLHRGRDTPAEQAAMRAVTMMCPTSSGATSAFESSVNTRTPSAERLRDRVPRLVHRRWGRGGRQVGGLKPFERGARGHSFNQAGFAGRVIDVGHDAARETILAIADPRRPMPDGGGGNAELAEIIEPADPGALAPDAGIAQDDRLHAGFRRAIGRIFAAMRCRDRRAPARFRGQDRDAVEDE